MKNKALLVVFGTVCLFLSGCVDQPKQVLKNARFNSKSATNALRTMIAVSIKVLNALTCLPDGFLSLLTARKFISNKK
uniref:hypothetical protein n=1 Tax=Xenorhabdus sp. KJ12.1 TaxID=1851571 RepID=UPI001290836F|nr:hypothetical protein [Xenorhabdus sp. KJ12.1]